MRPSARRTGTTVVAIVGDDTRACLERLDRGANVVTLAAEPDADPLDRAVAAWSAATRVHTPYFAHDADPLDATASAWVRRFDGDGPIGELEVAVSDTLARWRAGSIEVPDYYLVLDAETWPPTRKHWYLGVLHAAAPARVVPVPNADAAASALAPHDGSLNSKPGYPARGRFAPHDASLNSKPGYPARGRFAPN